MDKVMQMNNNSQVNMGEDEVTLIDTLRFLKSVSKMAVVTGLQGIISAVVYLAMNPSGMMPRRKLQRGKSELLTIIVI